MIWLCNRNTLPSWINDTNKWKSGLESHKNFKKLQVSNETRFVKFLSTNFCAKVAQKFGNLCVYFIEHSFLTKTFGHLLEFFWATFIPTFGHTEAKLPLVDFCSHFCYRNRHHLASSSSSMLITSTVCKNPFPEATKTFVNSKNKQQQMFQKFTLIGKGIWTRGLLNMSLLP